MTSRFADLPAVETDANGKVQFTRYSFRQSGKVHRAVDIDGFQTASCTCPGSRNGRLLRGAVRVAEGWAIANCGN